MDRGGGGGGGANGNLGMRVGVWGRQGWLFLDNGWLIDIFIGGMTPIFSHYIFFELDPAFLYRFPYSELRPSKVTTS